MIYRINSSGQIQVYQDQVRQFSITIIQLEKTLSEEREERTKIQSDFDQPSKTGKNISPSYLFALRKGFFFSSPIEMKSIRLFFVYVYSGSESTSPSPAVESVVPVVPVLTAPLADLR